MPSFVPDKAAIQKLSREIASDVAREAQPAVDRLASASKGESVDTIIPKLQKLLASHAVEVPDATLREMAEVISEGGSISLKSR